MIRQESFLNHETTSDVFDELYQTVGMELDSASADFVSQGIINSTRMELDTDETAADLTSRRDRWKTWTPEQRDDICTNLRAADETTGLSHPVDVNSNRPSFQHMFRFDISRVKCVSG